MTRFFALIFLTVSLLAAQKALAATSTQAVGPVAVQVADLKDQLEKGLKARLPNEFAFIATVVTMAENNQLSIELVKSTFQWAREKAKVKQYPFPYFERGLRERATKLGIAIP